MSVRYIKGEIIPVENMDVETEFMDPPIKNQECFRGNLVSQNFFEETLRIRSQKVPKKIWILRVALGLLLLILMAFTLSIFLVGNYHLQQSKF